MREVPMRTTDLIAGPSDGFTLIEMLIGLVLGSLMVLSLFDFLSSQQRVYMVQEQVADMQQNARAAMDILTREIRMAGYNPASMASPPGIIPINTSSTATANSLRFTADLNSNGTTGGDPNEDITYSYDGNSLTLQITRRVGAEAAQPVAERVTALSFKYYDAAGSEMSFPISSANLVNIRQITISLTTRTSAQDPNYPNNGGYRTTTLTTVITPRNLQR